MGLSLFLPIPMLLELYTNQGLHPSIVKTVAAGEGIAVTVPDNFSNMIADLHSSADRKEVSAKEAKKYAIEKDTTVGKLIEGLLKKEIGK